MTFINTSRLVIRNVAPTDADIIFDYRNNPACSKYQRGQTRTLDGIRELLLQHANDRLTNEADSMLAVSLIDGELVGEIVVMPAEGTFSLGYTFSYKHHRRGYAFESVGAVVNLLHEKYPDWDFVSFTDPENTASIGLLLKLGYTDMGYAPKITSRVFGKYLRDDTTAELTSATEH